MRIKFFLFTIILLNPILVFAGSNDQEIIKNAFLNDISTFVRNIMASSELSSFITAITLFILLIVCVIEITHFIFNGFEFQRVAEVFLWCVFAFALRAMFDPMLTAIWNGGQAIGDIIQNVAVGNSDPFFMTKWVEKTINSIVASDISIWDSIAVILIGTLWFIICSFINFVMWLCFLFSVFGYALAKMVGLFFIPFIMLSGTRPMFDSWLRFFVGFVILSVLLRVTSVLLVILIKAQLSSVATFNGLELAEGINFDFNDGFVVNVISTGLVAIIFVLSSFSFARQLGAGIGSGSGGISRAISGAIKLAMKLI